MKIKSFQDLRKLNYNIDVVYTFTKNDFPKIISSIFPNIEQIETFDVPFSLIINKKNELKLIEHTNEDGKTSIYPLDLYDLKEISLEEINNH
jgi:hypothetical protein